ncbi:MAG TPA: DUF1398 family protein [Mucilaginibacter sp.]
MFTVEQIKAVHSKVKSGADFPDYVQEIKALGLIRYEYIVSDGRTIYYGDNNFITEAPQIYPEKRINPISSASTIEHVIREHQQGKSDFLTFCQLAADAGVHHWEVNTQTMLCTYFDNDDKSMLAEPIPQGKY